MCCGGLFECLHLWGVARCCYECSPEDEYRANNKLKPWVQRYSAEEKRGFILLQREQRLKEQGGEVLHPLSDNKFLDAPPNYDERSPSLERQLAEVRQQYWLHQQELAKIESEKPKGPTIDLWDMLRRVQNGQGKSIAWEEASRACASLGGCCGRDCDCCSKPLKEFWMPSTSGGKRKKSGIYGHCTIECLCCIRYRGFHKPDSDVRLPEIQ